MDIFGAVKALVIILSFISNQNGCYMNVNTKRTGSSFRALLLSCYLILLQMAAFSQTTVTVTGTVNLPGDLSGTTV